MMNLINDPWIPVRRADGTTSKIEPSQITEDISDEKRQITAVASPRPDFDGALVQFLIGLLQTTCTPPDVFTWRKWRRAPPVPSELKAYFGTIAHAFELDGEKAFMQDFTHSELSDSKIDISSLLIEAPGENTQKQNRDHFVKRGRIVGLCPDCAAAALFTLQTNAPSGGQGHRTGLRGGGPLTTIALGLTLWGTCWLNVLLRHRYLGNGESDKKMPEARFPWLAATRTSEGKPPAGITTPVDVHADQMYWATPRRIRLFGEHLAEAALCDLCGTRTNRIFRSFQTRIHGVNYTGFEHPLSPHYVKGGTPSPVHPQPGGIGYRHWLGLIENSPDTKGEHRPAKVVEQFRSIAGEDGRLWAFGFDIVPGQANARCWYDSRMPILHMKGDQGAIFSAHVGNMVRAARYVSGLAISAVIRATMLDPKKEDTGQGYQVKWKLRGDLLPKLKRTPTERAKKIEDDVNAFPEALEARAERNLLTLPLLVRDQFWAITERPFFQRAAKLRDAMQNNESEQQVLRGWHKDIKNAVRQVFQTYTQVGDFDAADPRRVALAWNEMESMMKGSRLRDLLGLPNRRQDDYERKGGNDDQSV
jgi:CRISPR system Cascade subunit CasA